MGAAKQTQARLVDQRARRRATSDLVARHAEEYRALYEEHLVTARAEVAVLAAAAPPENHGEPVRLMPGRRRADEAPQDRIDVARCPHCIKSHDRGHVCAKCGAVPKMTFNEQVDEVRRMYDRGVTTKVIATTLRMPVDHVNRLLDDVDAVG